MPDELKEQALRMKTAAGFPLWYFSGLGVIALIVLGVMISAEWDKKENARLMGEPKAGDVYEVKTTDNHYTSMKISHLTRDTVYFYFNQYEVDRITGMDRIKKEENYSKEATGISLPTLQQLFDEGEVVDIERN